MGQARLRGSREERIARTKATKQPPKPGLYISTREVDGMRLIVEDVTVIDEGEDEGFFLVSMIDAPSSSDCGACGDELDPDQWFELVERYGLVLSA